MIDATEVKQLREELARTRRKCFRLKQEIRTMHDAFDDGQIAALRAEAEAYKRALSNILYRLDEEGTVNDRTLRSIVTAGLGCRTVRASRRRLIEGKRGAA